MEKNYKGYWSAGRNHNTTAMEDTNINRLRRRLRSIARESPDLSSDQIGYSITWNEGGRQYVEDGSFVPGIGWLTGKRTWVVETYEV